jgi:hypothetical protein
MITDAFRGDLCRAVMKSSFLPLRRGAFQPSIAASAHRGLGRRKIMMRKLVMGLTAVMLAAPALAQQAPVPGWAVGRPEGSTLAPHAPRLTVTPLAEVPVGAIRLPPGFQAEVSPMAFLARA